MTSEEYKSAIEFVAHVIKLVNDPVAMSRLKRLTAEADGTLEWVQKFEPVPGYENEAKRGTCPTCERKFSLNNDETVRRHRVTRYGSERCQYDKQLPAEIIPAVLLIAGLSDNAEGDDLNDGTQQADTHHV